MTRHMARVALAFAGIGLASCGGNRAATDAAPGGGACFRTSQVSAISPIDSETAILRVGNAAYQLKIVGVCPDLNWSTGVVLMSETEDASLLCTGQPVTVQTPSPRGGQQQCFGNELLMAPPPGR